MALDHFGGRVVVPAAASTLTTLLGITLPGDANPGRGYKTLVLRSDSANAARVYFGPTNAVTAAGVAASGYLAAGESVAFDMEGGGIAWTGEFWVIGNGADLLYVDVHE